MPLTGREVGRLATTAAISLLLGLLAILLLTSRDTGPTTAGGDGRSTLEVLPDETPSAGPSADDGPRPTAPAATSPVPTAGTGAGPTPAPPVAEPGATAPPAAPGPGPSTAPPSPPAPGQPAPTSSSPTSAPPSPTSVPLLVRATSPLPPSCVRVGQACTYVDAPAGSRLGSGPESLSVSVLPSGRVSVSARAGRGAVPDVVGLVVRICTCAGPADEDVVLEARLAGPSGSVEVDLPRDRVLQVWVQELNEAGLGPGTVQSLPAVAPPTTPTPTPSASPSPG